MAKSRKPGVLFIFVLIIITLVNVVPGRIPGQAQPAAEVAQKLKGVSEEEKAILENLFLLSQEIEEMDREQADIAQEIELLNTKTGDIREKIEYQQRDYDNKLDILKQVLVSYQRRGPVSYLKTLLSARDLTSFLRSINIIKDLTRNTGELLDSLEKRKEELMAEQSNLAENTAALETKKEKLQETLAKKLQLREEQEAYLYSLKEEGEHFRELLGNLQGMWDRIKVLFTDIITEFDEIIGEGKFPMQDLNLSFGLLSVRGTIRQQTLNDVFKEHSSLPEVVFRFHSGQAEVEVPEMHLVLRGTFSVQGGSSLIFVAEEGEFYGMELEKASIEELFRYGYLMIDFGRLMGNITLQSVNVRDGYLEFTVRPGF